MKSNLLMIFMLPLMCTSCSINFNEMDSWPQPDIPAKSRHQTLYKFSEEDKNKILAVDFDPETVKKYIEMIWPVEKLNSIKLRHKKDENKDGKIAWLRYQGLTGNRIWMDNIHEKEKHGFTRLFAYVVQYEPDNKSSSETGFTRWEYQISLFKGNKYDWVICDLPPNYKEIVESKKQAPVIVFDQIKGEGEENIELKRENAEALFEKGDLAGAREICEKILVQDPYDKETFNLLKSIWEKYITDPPSTKFVLNDTSYVLFRFSPMSDNGVELEKYSDGKLQWKQESQPLGVAYSEHYQKVNVYIKNGNIFVESIDSNGEITEIRDIETGKLLKRTVNKKWLR